MLTLKALMNCGIRVACIILVLLLSPKTEALAQNIPGSADPARVPSVVSPVTPKSTYKKVEKKKESELELPDEIKKIVFQFHTLKLEGITVYPPNRFQYLYEKKIGQTISLAEIYRIASQIERQYHEDGYLLSRTFIPEQDIQNGELKIIVLEGYVDQLELDGTFKESSIISDVTQKIRKMKPLNLFALERMLLVLNKLPDLNVGVILATPDRADAAPGAVKVILKNASNTGDNPVQITVDNYGSLYSGPWQGNAASIIPHVGLNYSTLFASANITRPTSESALGLLSFSAPIFGASGTQISFSISKTKTQPGLELEPLETEGSSLNTSAQISYPILLKRDREWSVFIGFSTKESSTDILDERLYLDRTRTLDLGTTYSWADQWLGVSSLEGRITKGLNILSARKTNSPDLSRAEGHSDFLKFSGQAARLQRLSSWLDLSFRLEGQYSNVPLLSGEELGVGGSKIGRGYDPSEITGDKGILSSIELRFNPEQDTDTTTLQPYIFYDFGKVWNNDSGLQNSVSLASTGLGTRIDLMEDININITAAFPLTKNVDTPFSYGNPGSARYLFSLNKSF